MNKKINSLKVKGQFSCIDKIIKTLFTKEERRPIDLPYHSLSPVNKADSNYQDALSWALSNRESKDIKNLAITGPYGSGKSSVIKSFQKSDANKYNFLNISLASFKEIDGKDKLDDEIKLKPDDKPKANDETKNKPDDDIKGLQRQLEISILQQMIYHVGDDEIPDSQFSRIRKRKSRPVYFQVFGLITLVIAVFFLKDQEGVLKLLQTSDVSKLLLSYLHYSALFTTICSSGYILFVILRIVHSMNISKVKIPSTGIELSKNIDKSILNNHIDEIIYFFEMTKKNVIVVEDLDRFKQTEIFTKLREINFLINSSNRIKDVVVFVYAVRDDMFHDQDRIKFFDFIIPIIPVINSSNSSSILLDKKKKNGYKISDELLEIIALFIGDMRLLHNIMNEFHLYHTKLDKKLVPDKLMAMITYKNLCPEDFMLLSNNEGGLYSIFQSKRHLINQKLHEVDKEIEVLEGEISVIDKTHITDVKELRSLYVLGYLSAIPLIHSFYIKGKQCQISEMKDDSNFHELVNNNVIKYYRTSHLQSQLYNINIPFKQIEEGVNGKWTYAEREVQIINKSNNKQDALRREIQCLKQSKNKLKRKKLREFALDDLDLNFTLKPNQLRLVKVLINEGTICEDDYLDYISHFHEGSLTRDDHEFLLNVKAQIYTQHDIKLFKIKKLITKIDPYDFGKMYVLNYSLVDFLLKNEEEYTTQLFQLFNLLSSEDDRVVRFIDGYIQSGNVIEPFVLKLCENWGGIWSYVTDKSNYPEDKVKNYYHLIIQYADILSLAKINFKPQFKNYILQDKNFLEIPNVEEDRFEKIINELGLKFANVDLAESSDTLFKFIYSKNHYALNQRMLISILTKKNKYSKTEFETRNYYSVCNSGCNSLIEYIHNDINKYVEQVYLKISSNTSEDLDSYLELLSYKDLSDENKKNLISHVQTKIKNLYRINDAVTLDYLIKEFKVIPTWRNVLYYYKSKQEKFNAHLVSYMSNEDNGVVLSKSKIPIEKNDEGEDINKDFAIALLKLDKIEYSTYEMLLASQSYIWTNFDFKSLSKNMVLSLISNERLSFSKDNFDQLASEFPNCLAGFIELNKEKFISNLNGYKVSNEVFFNVLKSKKISPSEKDKIIHQIENKSVLQFKPSQELILELFINEKEFEIDSETLFPIICNTGLSKEERIMAYNIYADKYGREDTFKFLVSLGDDYVRIPLLKNQPKIVNNQVNEKLVKILKEKKLIIRYESNKDYIKVFSLHK